MGSISSTLIIPEHERGITVAYASFEKTIVADGEDSADLSLLLGKPSP